MNKLHYVYVVVNSFKDVCAVVEVYDSEKLAKTRAEKLNAKYYKCHVNNNIVAWHEIPKCDFETK